MIAKNEVVKLAKSLNLRPETVEKDYVLSWMLFSVNSNQRLREKWIFKGGTSLKKCFFETFRFSEDLDFTLSDSSHFNKQFLLEEFHKTADLLYEETGIEFAKDKFTFKIIDKAGGKTAQGKIHFNGPLRRRKGKYAAIKLDLTNDEILILDPKAKKIYHPYSDKPKTKMKAVCYAFEEVIAEKTRALAQRARPRDLYDIIHFFRNRNMISSPRLVYDVLRKKCAFKNIEVPTFQFMEKHEKIKELKNEWKNMLAHQLSFLPPLESFWKDLSPFFQWLTGTVQEKESKPLPKQPDESIFNPGRITGTNTANAVLYKIQFAAANRVCVKLLYANKSRIAEPLSFRTVQTTGTRLFYGMDREDNQVKVFHLEKIQSVEVTNAPYTEKYPVEITASGKISKPPRRLKDAY